MFLAMPFRFVLIFIAERCIDRCAIFFFILFQRWFIFLGFFPGTMLTPGVKFLIFPPSSFITESFYVFLGGYRQFDTG